LAFSGKSGASCRRLPAASISLEISIINLPLAEENCFPNRKQNTVKKVVVNSGRSRKVGGLDAGRPSGFCIAAHIHTQTLTHRPKNIQFN
jgi:hypothetical protein